MIVGDSPQAMIVNLERRRRRKTSSPTAEAAGFNALWVDLLCAKYTGWHETTGARSTASGRSRRRATCRLRIRRTSRASTRWSAWPRRTGWSCSSIRSRPAAGSSVLQAQRRREGCAYGRFLGKRYAKLPEHRVDERQRLPDVEKCRRSMPSCLPSRRGSGATDRRHIQTVELNYTRERSLDDRAVADR